MEKATPVNKSYMVEFYLPQEFTEEFMALIPQQRYVINQMLVEGVIQSYSLAEDRSRLWAVMTVSDPQELKQQIERMPLAGYMEWDISELAFHNMASAVMHFSLN